MTGIEKVLAVAGLLVICFFHSATVVSQMVWDPWGFHVGSNLPGTLLWTGRPPAFWIATVVMMLMEVATMVIVAVVFHLGAHNYVAWCSKRRREQRRARRGT